MNAPALPWHAELRDRVAAPAEALFAWLDDPAHLAGHMAERSWRMGGGRMTLQLDAQGGRALGSRLALSGHAFGLKLELVEAITQREPPWRKAWATQGEPRLLAIGPYRLGFEIAPGEAADCELRLSIDYARPAQAPWRWLARWLAPAYARWCLRRMLDEARAHFTGLPAQGRAS